MTAEFWNFSLALYACSGVAEYCLRLQDEAGANVNLLLLCCWAGRRGVRLDANTLVATLAAIEDWEAQVVQPLRARRRTPGLAPDARQRLLAEELSAERYEQTLLLKCLENRGLLFRNSANSDTELVRTNLLTYGSILNAEFGDYCPLLTQTSIGRP